MDFIFIFNLIKIILFKVFEIINFKNQSIKNCFIYLFNLGKIKGAFDLDRSISDKIQFNASVIF